MSMTSISLLLFFITSIFLYIEMYQPLLFSSFFSLVLLFAQLVPYILLKFEFLSYYYNLLLVQP